MSQVCALKSQKVKKEVTNEPHWHLGITENGKMSLQ